ncbi:Ionotropic receptor 25a [Trichinella pseudospiralis]
MAVLMESNEQNKHITRIFQLLSYYNNQAANISVELISTAASMLVLSIKTEGNERNLDFVIKTMSNWLQDSRELSKISNNFIQVIPPWTAMLNVFRPLIYYKHLINFTLIYDNNHVHIDDLKVLFQEKHVNVNFLNMDDFLEVQRILEKCTKATALQTVVLMMMANPAREILKNFSFCTTNNSIQWIVVTKDMKPYTWEDDNLNVLWIRPRNIGTFDYLDKFIYWTSEKKFDDDFIQLGNEVMLSFFYDIYQLTVSPLSKSSLNLHFNKNELTPVMGKYSTINNITFIQNVEMGFYWIFSNLKGREIYYIAKWKLKSGIDIFYKTGLSGAIVNARHYRIATVEEVPFVKMCFESNTKRLNFTYDIYILKNDEYGVQNNVGRWNGLTNELVEGDANIALGNFATSAERELFIDFTYPFYKSKGITILMQKPECKHGLFAFVSLMDWLVWLCLVFTILIASALLTLFENVHSRDCETDHIKYDNNKKRTRFAFSEGFWFCLEGFTVQGSNWAPEHDSGRILATTWWIFCFMIFSAYTAYISALMSKSSEENLISSLDDLVDQRHTPYATVLNSDADLFIKRMVEIEKLFEKTWKKNIQSPNLTAEQRVNMALWDYDIKYKFSKMLHEMQNAHQPSSFTEGLQRVLKLNSPEDRFALLDMRMSMEYAFIHHCSLRLIYTNLNSQLYAIGVQQGSPLGLEMSAELVKLTHEQQWETLFKKWWYNDNIKSSCPGRSEKPDIIFGKNEEDGNLNKLITLFQTVFKYQHSVGYPTNRKFDIKIEVSNEVKYNESINGPTIFINFSNDKNIISELKSLSVTNNVPVVQLYLDLGPIHHQRQSNSRIHQILERILSFTILYDEDHEYYTIAQSLQSTKTGNSTAIKLSPETDSQWMPECSEPNKNITMQTFIMICNVRTVEKYAARLEKCVIFGYVNIIVFTMDTKQYSQQFKHARMLLTRPFTTDTLQIIDNFIEWAMKNNFTQPMYNSGNEVKISFFLDLSALILTQFDQWKENSAFSDTTVNCFVEQSLRYRQFKNECKWYCVYGSYVAFEKSVFAQDIVLNTYRIEANDKDKDIYFVGNWTMSRGIRYTNKFGFSLEATKVRHFRVATSVLPPFIEEYREYPGGPLQLRGLCIDLLEILSKSCNFTYEISTVLESVGVRNAAGRWNGIAGELICGNANIGLMTFVTTPENEQVLDFTYPFYERTGLALLLLKYDYNVTVFNCVTLMEWPVWICTCLAILIMSAVLTVIDQYSPFSYRNNRSNYGEDDPDNCIFTYKESLWFCLRSFTPQGGGQIPKSMSGRIVVASCATRVETTVTSLDDLLKQSRIRYSTVLHSSAEAYIQRQANIEASFYEKWKVAARSKTLSANKRVSLSNWDYPMKDKFTEMLRLIKEVGQPLDVASGVRRVLETNFLNERFALIGQQSVFEYEALLHCELQVVPLNLNLLPYVIAVQEGSSLKSNLSKGILELVSQRKMLQLKKKWMDDNPNKKDCSSYEKIAGMSMMDIMGVLRKLEYVVYSFRSVCLGDILSPSSEGSWSSKIKDPRKILINHYDLCRRITIPSKAPSSEISKELSSQSEDVPTLSSEASINLEQQPIRAEKVQSLLPKHETQTEESSTSSDGFSIDQSHLCGFNIAKIYKICERNLCQAIRDGATCTHFSFSKPNVFVVPARLFSTTKKLEKKRDVSLDFVNTAANVATWKCMTCNGRNSDKLSYCNLCMFPRSSETILPQSAALNNEKEDVGSLSEKHIQGELNLKMLNDNKRSGERSSNFQNRYFTKKFKPSEKCIICGLSLDFGSGRKCSSCEKFDFYEPITDVKRNVLRMTKSSDGTIRRRWNRRRFAAEQSSVLSGWTCKGCLFLNKPISQICFRCGCSSDSVQGGDSSSWAWKCPACFVSNDAHSKRCVNCLALRPSKSSLKNEKSWRCTGCFVLNSDNFDNCLQCKMPRLISKENISDVSSSNSQSFTVIHDGTADDVQKYANESSSIKSDLPKWYCTICFLGNVAEQLFCSSCNALKPGSFFQSVSIDFAATTEDESANVEENGEASTSVATKGNDDSTTSAVHFKAPDLSPPPSPLATTEKQAEAQPDEEDLCKIGQPQPKSSDQQQQDQDSSNIHFSDPLHTETVFNSDSSVLSITGCSETSTVSLETTLQICSTPPPTTVASTTTTTTTESEKIVEPSINSPPTGLFSKIPSSTTENEIFSEPKTASASPSVLRLGIESETVYSKKTSKRSLFSTGDELTTSAPSFTFNFGQQKASTDAVTSSEDTKISSATVSSADFGATTGDPIPSKSPSTPVSSENVFASQNSSASGGIFSFGSGNFASTTSTTTPQQPQTTPVTATCSSSSGSSSFVFHFGSTNAQSSPFAAKPFTFSSFSNETPTSSTNSRLSLPCLTTAASTMKTPSFPTFSFSTPTSVPFAFNFGSKSESLVTTTTTTVTPTGAAATMNFGFPTVVTTSTSNVGSPFFSFSANASAAAAAAGISQTPLNSGFNFQIPSSTPTFAFNVAASMAPTFNFATPPSVFAAAGVGTPAQPQIGTTPFVGASDMSSSVSKRQIIIPRRKKRRA